MIAIGIPSYNEADNIVQLASAIDQAAVKLNIEILIINADNNSPDLTAYHFRSMRTYAEKISLITEKQGKGHNIKAIIDYVSKRNDVTYCVLIDGDITSFDPQWLLKHVQCSNEGNDYVIPNYSRYMQEGNTTNHFIFPLLFSLTNGCAPYQGIAGDFGLSKYFVDYLAKQSWPDSALEYGVDIFMTMHALFSGMRVSEIVLDSKIHKPSFDKMVSMFRQVAESYFETRNKLLPAADLKFVRPQGSELSLLHGEKIHGVKLLERQSVAIELYEMNEENGLHISDMPTGYKLNLEEWVNVLLLHEKSRLDYTPAELARCLTPFYLLRVVTYLQTKNNPNEAVKEITQTAVLLKYEMQSVL